VTPEIVQMMTAIGVGTASSASKMEGAAAGFTAAGGIAGLMVLAGAL